MYTDFYGLKGFPFQLTPDPRFFFESTVHRKAMAHLLFGLEQGEGFIVITGDVGAGKTTLLDRLLSSLDPKAYVTAKVVSTHLLADDMLRTASRAFDLRTDGDKASLLSHIEQFLASNYQRGLRTLLLIDEAQNITPQALEELRMLSNFQVGARVPLQSFLLGQPQFRRTLSAPDLEQFRQRIIASYHLGPMREEETREYIHHRLSVVGWKNDPTFDDDIFPEIYTYTSGLPRKINAFCNRLMLLGFLDELHRIGREAVRTVAEDMSREASQVLDSSDGNTSTGVMHSTETSTDPEALLRRIERLERQVARHTRALHFFSALVEGTIHNTSEPQE